MAKICQLIAVSVSDILLLELPCHLQAVSSSAFTKSNVPTHLTRNLLFWPV